MKRDMRRYNRVARFYDVMESLMEVMNFRRWRRMLFNFIEKEGENLLVLEIGSGTGKNLPFYPDFSFAAVDISEKMLKRAVEKNKRCGKRVDFVIGDAEKLPFRDEAFDVVFSTFVFCSVDNPVNGLREAYRVLKKEGKAYFLEHMLPENRVIQPFFHLLNPLTRLFGPEINRRTDENIKKAGFRILKQYFLLGSVFRLIVADKAFDSGDKTLHQLMKHSEPSNGSESRRFNLQHLLPLRLTVF